MRGLRIGFNTLYEDPRRPTGSHDYNIQLVRHLGARSDVELVVFVSPAGQPYFEPVRGSARLVRCGRSNENLPARIATEHTLLPLALSRERCDVLFAPGNTAPLVAPCPFVLNVKTVQHLVRPEGLSGPRYWYRTQMIRRSAQHARLVIANTESTRQHLIELLSVPQERIRIVPEGLDHDLFRPPADRERLRQEHEATGLPAPYVLFVSGLWRYKNVETLIAAFELVANAGLPHHLLLAGAGDPDYEHELREQAAASRFAVRIRFLGQVARADTARLVQGAEALVLPSLYESFGKTITEAMACGTPVIAAQASCLPEVVGDAGLLCSPTDPEAYADAIRQVVEDSGLRARLVAAGLERAAGFSWDRTAELTLAALEDAA